jgi:hypothetical protein
LNRKIAPKPKNSDPKIARPSSVVRLLLFLGVLIIYLVKAKMSIKKVSENKQNFIRMQEQTECKE